MTRLLPAAVVWPSRISMSTMPTAISSCRDVLEHLGVSRSYFSTVFKEKTGQSFVEYLTNLRMEKAKEYLRETGLCTYEIAERIGFADPHYFSLSFRRRTGMTPKQYREAETKQ